MYIKTLWISCLFVLTYGFSENLNLSWTPQDSMQTKALSDVQASPDTKSALFVVETPDMEAGKWIPRIYVKSPETESAVPLLDCCESSRQPRWSPDGKWVAYISCSDKDYNLNVISLKDKKKIPLTTGSCKVQTFAWSPDGQTIAFVMSDKITPLCKTSYRALKEEKYINRLWTVDVFSATPTPKVRTSEEYCIRGFGDLGTMYTEFDWSPDGSKIVFAHSPDTTLDSWCLDSSIAELHLDTGEIIPWEKKFLFEALPKYSPDGTHIAYVVNSSSRRYGGSKRIAVRPDNGQPEILLAHTFNESPHLLGWTQDGERVIICEPKGTKYHLSLLPIDGSVPEEIDTGPLSFRELSLNGNRTTLGMIIQSSSTPPEAYISGIHPFVPLQISHINDELLSYPLTKTEVISWASSDGLTIEGLFTYPCGYEKGKQYPLLVIVHGGPASFFSEMFIGDAQTYPIAAFAQAGFGVLRPNPRGSLGYGYPFRYDNHQDWGGMDFLDIMTGVDFLLDQKIADPQKLGIMGWSYGGYMTAWAITQTDRFKAASVGAGIVNLVSMNGTTDLNRFLTEYLGEFSENILLYEERSPLYHVKAVSTPCLIQHGELDVRVPSSQAYEFYHALERLGKEVTLSMYPNCGHGLGDPRIKLNVMEQNLQWFQKHLIQPQE